MRQFLFFALMCFFSLSTFTIYAIPPVFEEYGKAGYYADKLHGRKTASGQVYDKDAMTCAHKTLPFGTKVKVTRLDNGESVIVTVNDRGPYSAGYVVDVSRKAAVALGIIKAGHAKVKLEIANDEPAENTEVKPLPDDQFVAAEETPKTENKPKIKVLKAAVPSAASTKKADVPTEYSTPTVAKAEKSSPRLLTPKGGEAAPKSIAKATEPEAASAPAASPAAAGKRTLYKIDIAEAVRKGAAVQVGTLYDADNVLPILRKLRKDWPGKVLVDLEQVEGSDIVTYRVMVGPFANKKAAEAAQKIAKKKGYKESFVVEFSAE